MYNLKFKIHYIINLLIVFFKRLKCLWKNVVEKNMGYDRFFKHLMAVPGIYILLNVPSICKPYPYPEK